MVALLVGLSNWPAFARDDGRYANGPLKHWFDNLTGSNGNCCSFADGLSISDVDWETKDGHYRVLLHGEWDQCAELSSCNRAEPLWSSGRLALHGYSTVTFTFDVSCLEPVRKSVRLPIDGMDARALQAWLRHCNIQHAVHIIPVVFWRTG